MHELGMFQPPLINIRGDKMNSLEKGRIGELKAITKFIENGFQVYEPVVDIYESDFVAVINGEFKKFQVKTTEKLVDGKIKMDFRRTSGHKKGKYTHQSYTNIDYYVIYCIENDYIGILPFNGTGDSITIRFTQSKNGQTKGINWSKDYEIDNFIKSL